MALATYNGFTHSERMAGYRIVEDAIASGAIPPPRKCNRCGQTEGLIVYHSEDYTPVTILKQIEPLCGRCHDMICTEIVFT